MKLLRTLSILIFVVSITPAFSQDPAQTDSVSNQTEKQEIFRQHHIGSSLFMLFNFLPDPADYYILSYGYYFTQKDVLIVEAQTWTYYEPIGTYGDSKELYPGKVIAYGIGLGYQRFHWKNLYTTVEATNLVQQFYDEDDKKIQKGFQLYLQFILGYRFEFLNDRMFVEPALALKYWPVNSNFPKSFADIERGKPEHIFEPSLLIGFRF